MADTLLLCTSVGPHLLTRHLLRAIATALALPRWTVKSWTVNPSTDKTVEKFAMQLDMLSPFLPPSHDTGVTALVLPPWPKRWEAKAREVAISLSLWESLLLAVRCLPHLLRISVMRADPAMRVIELAREDTADEPVDMPIVQLRAAQLERGSDSTRWDAEATRTDAKAGYTLTALKRLLDDMRGQAHAAGMV
jgi:hypothetical protein